jgi:hypothetical protein
VSWTTDTKWLNSLKAGDKVAIARDHDMNGYHILEVNKTTKTIIDCGVYGAFRRKDGYIRGSVHFHRKYIEPITDLVRATNRRLRYLRQLNTQKWDSLPDEMLEKMVALLPVELKP